MTFTLGITGMDARTEAELRAAFDIANNATGRHWSLAGADADIVAVDMDSLYGPMSWLRLHAAGKRVIGLTAMERTQTDFRLSRPIDAAALATLLEELAGDLREKQPSITTMAPDPAPLPPMVATEPAPPNASMDAPVDAPLADADAQAGTLAREPAAVASDGVAPGNEIAPVDAAFAPNVPRKLADWLGPRGLQRRVRLQRGDAPLLLIDVPAGLWHGPAALKPLSGYFEDMLPFDGFQTPSDAEWEAEAASLGAPQPLSRLRWFGGLLAGKGEILDGYDPSGRFRLLKWPQTEREYPKHFRIATAMMKAPATIAEIAEASGVGREEVADFVNANLATGYAEPATVAPAEPAVTSARSGGLLDRIRGR